MHLRLTVAVNRPVERLTVQMSGRMTDLGESSVEASFVYVEHALRHLLRVLRSPV